MSLKDWFEKVLMSCLLALHAFKDPNAWRWLGYVWLLVALLFTLDYLGEALNRYLDRKLTELQ